jgi:hypothetical protein
MGNRNRMQTGFFLVVPLVAALLGCHGPEERPAPGLLGDSRHVWDEAAYETVAWCGPALGPTVLR